jgi:hypothetical protein
MHYLNAVCNTLLGITVLSANWIEPVLHGLYLRRRACSISWKPRRRWFFPVQTGPEKTRPTWDASAIDHFDHPSSSFENNNLPRVSTFTLIL